MPSQYENPFIVEQPQQQQGQQQQMNPLQGLQMYNQFSGGEMFGGGESGGMFGFGGGSAGTTGGTAGATSGSASGGSAMGGMGGWAALAALIIGNEHEAKEGGYRDEDDWDYAQDLIGGKVAAQDMQERWIPKLVGEDDDYGFGGDLDILAELSSHDFSNALEAMKTGTLGKILGLD